MGRTQVPGPGGSQGECHVEHAPAGESGMKGGRGGGREGGGREKGREGEGHGMSALNKVGTHFTRVQLKGNSWRVCNKSALLYHSSAVTCTGRQWRYLQHIPYTECGTEDHFRYKRNENKIIVMN